MESTNERLLHCNLCNARFRDTPCQLPCLHSFCESCLVQLLDTRANDPQCSTSILFAAPNDNSESESHEEKRIDISPDLEVSEQVKPESSTVITSVENAGENEMQDVGFKTDQNSAIKTVENDMSGTNDLVTVEENEDVDTKVKDTIEDSESGVLLNDTSNGREISADEKTDPATCTDIVKSVRICSFIICPTCKLEVKLTPLDQSLVDQNQLETAHRLVRASFPVNHFLSHLISVRMRSTGKKDCETCKMRQNLIKDGKKKEKAVTADAMCINCDQLMCRQCRVTHDGFKPFQSHNIIDVISDESKGLFSRSFRRNQPQQPIETAVVHTPTIQIKAKYGCPTHSEQFILFCSRCQVALCSQCMSSHFRDETFGGELCPAPILIGEAAKNERQQAKILQTDLSEQMQQKLKFIDELNERIGKSNEIKAKSTKKINSLVVQMKETIDSSLKEVYKNTGNILESKKEEFRRMVESSKIQEVILKDLSTYLSVALTQAPDEQISTVIQDVNKAFTLVERNKSTDSHTYDDFFNYGNTLSSLMENCLAVTLKNNNIDFKSNIETLDVFDSRDSDILSSTAKGQSSYLLLKSGDLKHAFLGSVNEVWDYNAEVLLFDLVVLDGGRIIISDFHNQSIKEFDENGHLLACCAVEGSPTGICVVSEHQVICALTWSKKLCFIMRDARGSFLAASSTVSVEKQYCGIALMTAQSLLCTCDNSVDWISFDGTILQTLSVLSGEHGPLVSPRHILVLPDSGYFLLSDAERNSLICCSMDGNVRFCYSGHADQSLSKPSGLSMDKKGFIYMADNQHNCIYRLTADGELDKLLFTEKDGINKPKALAVSAGGTKLYLTEIDSGIVKVLNVK